MIILKNHIKEIKNSIEVATLNEQSINSNTKFTIRLFAVIKKSNLLLEKTKSIELFFQSTDLAGGNDFNRMFPNTYSKETYDSKKYSKTTINDYFKNDIRTGLTIQYHNNSTLPTSLSSESFNKLFSIKINFDEENFIEDTNQYLIELNEEISKIIYQKNFDFATSRFKLNFFDKVRISLLDEENNILDISNFFGVDLSARTINENVKLESFKDYYLNEINEYVENFNFDFFFLNPVNSFNTGQINLFGNKTIFLQDGLITSELIYNNKNQKASLNFDNNPGVEQSFIINRFTLDSGFEFDNFIREIVKDYFTGVETFIIDINVDLFNIVKDDVTGEKNQHIKKYFFKVNFNRESDFIEKAISYCDSLGITGEIITEILNTINIEVLSTEVLGAKIGIDFNLSPNITQLYGTRILDNLLVEEINLSIDNKSSLDFYYNNPDFTLSNRVDYINKSIRFFNANSKIWSNVYLANVFRNTFDFSFKIKHSEKPDIVRIIEKSIDNFESTRKLELFVENTQNLTNKLFVENMFCSDIDFNLFLSESTGNIFNYELFILKNSNLFQDVAFAYGYSGEDNFREFLSNSILQISIQKSLNDTTLTKYEKYCNFNDFFINSDTNTRSYISNNSFLSNLHRNELNTRDSLEIIGNRYNSNDILQFFNKSEDSIYEKIIGLNNLDNFNIECTIKIQILPIPKVIKDNLGVGFLDNGNPQNYKNIDIIVQDEEKRDDIVKEFEIIYSDFLLFNTNDRIDRTFVNGIERLLFLNLENRNPSTYSELFDFFRRFNILERNLYTKKENINKEKIKNLLKILDDNDLENLINSSEIKITRDFYKLSTNTDYISYIKSELPISILYAQNFYDTNDKCFKPKEMKFFFDTSKHFYLDFDVLKKINRYNNVIVSPIIEINEVFQNFNSCEIEEEIIFILKTYSGVYNQDEINLSDNVYESSFYKGEFCLLNKRFLSSTRISSLGINKEIMGDYSSISEFFNYAKSKTFNVIKDIIIRTYLKFNIDNDEIKVIFNTSIPFINLSNQVVKIDDINIVSSRSVSN